MKVYNNIDTIIILKLADYLKVDPAFIDKSSLLIDDFLGTDTFNIEGFIYELGELLSLEDFYLSIKDIVEIGTVGRLIDLISRRIDRLPPKAIQFLSREGEIKHEYKGRIPKRIRFILKSVKNMLKRLRRKILRISAFSLIAILSTYYLIIFAHWDYIVKWTFTWTPVLISPLLVSILGIVIMLSGPAYIKALTFSKRGFKKIICFFSGIIILEYAIILFGSQAKLKSFWMHILFSNYMLNYHYFWLGLISMIFYMYLFARIRNQGEVNEFLDSFKTFPLVSPAFCFGAPVFWEKSLNTLGIYNPMIKVLSIVSFFVGIILLLAMVLFYVARNTDKPKTFSSLTTAIFDNSLSKGVNGKNFSLGTLSLFLVMLGTSGITFVCLEIGYLILISK